MAEFYHIVVALGANLGKPQLTFKQALQLISEQIGVVKKISSFIETEPLLHPDNTKQQNNYLNGTCLIETPLEPAQVIDILMKIEKSLGRQRDANQPWAARMIDLDFICADALVINSDKLTLPHPEMHKRDFVLRPMLEIWPEWQHPVLGLKIGTMLRELTQKSI